MLLYGRVNEIISYDSSIYKVITNTMFESSKYDTPKECLKCGKEYICKGVSDMFFKENPNRFEDLSRHIDHRKFNLLD